MFRGGALLALGAALIAAGACRGAGGVCANPPELLERGESAPDLLLHDARGQEVNLRELIDGKVAIVDVWATWCAPCLAAMPHLQAFHNKFRDRGFTVVGVMIDDNATRIGREYLAKRPVSYPILIDDGGARFSCAWGEVAFIPTMVVVGRDGKVLEVVRSAGDLDGALSRVEQYVTGAVPATASAPAT
ncbi:MAG: TlpA family protein disulfide reductase [Acidobacteria bacterium]|nr:TlpA family protein disulfide reductase [Acidobacteriota bacterium]